MPQSPTRAQTSTVSRRNFLKGRREPDKPMVVRPPWSDEQSILGHCTGCGECISACPEKILFVDQNSMPTVSFDAGECTFCGACADACEEPVFDISRAEPWALKVSVLESCLLKSGITCQLCTDVCDADALRFNMRVRPSGAIELDVDACTGCGACIAPCPVSAIAVRDDRLGATA